MRARKKAARYIHIHGYIGDEDIVVISSGMSFDLKDQHPPMLYFFNVNTPGTQGRVL
jgi:hypothetical protein